MYVIKVADKKSEIEVSKNLNRSSLHQASSRTKDRAGGGNEPGYRAQVASFPGLPRSLFFGLPKNKERGRPGNEARAQDFSVE